MPFTQLTIQSKLPLPIGATKGRDALRKVLNALTGVVSGTNKADSWVLLNDNTPQSGTTAAGAAARACAGVVLSGGANAVGIVVNSTSVTATWATSDTVSAGLIADAVNANTTVNPFVAATKYLATLTLASVTAGQTINICGQTFTATAAATGSPNEFSIAGTDTQDAAALAVAINQSSLNCKLVATSSAGVVYLGICDNRAARGDELISAAPSTITVSQFAARAACLVFARQPGLLGNCCTATATGTGVTAFSAVSGKLGGGLGGYLSTSQYLSCDSK